MLPDLLNNATVGMDVVVVIFDDDVDDAADDVEDDAPCCPGAEVDDELGWRHEVLTGDGA